VLGGWNASISRPEPISIDRRVACLSGVLREKENPMDAYVTARRAAERSLAKDPIVNYSQLDDWKGHL